MHLLSRLPKIFEVNPSNAIIKNLNENYQKEERKNEVRDTILTLFDVACIIEDEPIKDSKDFSRRIQTLMKN
ncbi:MAG: hypothetical protein HC887_11970 [Desulfobacteraceae bacterium]|nr:hypothetical protein [Desulfobacteraceae bacterium]